MVASALVFFLAGTCVGMRFGILAMALAIPAGLAASLALSASGLLGPGLWPQAIMWCGLQLGYFAGAVLDTCIVQQARGENAAV